MKLRTTTIGAYPKPEYVALPDWFGAAAGPDTEHPTEEWSEALARMGDDAEEILARGTKEVIDDRGRRVDSRRLMQPLYRFCSRLIYLGDVRMWVINRLFGHCEFLWAPGTLHLPLG